MSDSVRSDGANADDAYRETVAAAGLPREAQPSEGFFREGVEREVDEAMASIISAARDAAASEFSGGDADEIAGSLPFGEAKLFTAALDDARGRLRRLDEAMGRVSGNEIERRRREALEGGGSVAPLKIGVLVSGSGTNLQAIIDLIAAGRLNAQIVLVVASNGRARGLKRAADAGIPTMALSKESYKDPWDADQAIAQALFAAGAEYIIMAGYMRLVHAPLLLFWPERVVNIHPALLPSFQGAHGIDDAYARGVKVTGVTVHLANAVYDQGPIIAQEPVRIEEGMSRDALEAAIHEVEHRLYPSVVELLAEGRIRVRDDLTVEVLPGL